MVGKTAAIAVRVDVPVNMEVFSMDGKLVNSYAVMNNAEIAVEAGLYMVRLTNGKGCNVQKVFVK